jgi:DNA-3-methyladenine glycosylase
LKFAFYNRRPELVARELLGALLCRRLPEGLLAGRIVETEAYLPENDPACHAARGMTRRNTVMFGPPGKAYVYAIHSRWCFNIVTEPEGTACAVLVRALEPLSGIDLMYERRPGHALRDLARGPARLCQALGIDKRQNGCDLTTSGELWIAEGEKLANKRVLVSPRIGVTSAHDLPLRFFVKDSVYVSRTATGTVFQTKMGTSRRR